MEAVREELAASQESLNAMHIEKQKVESNLASAKRQIEDLNEFKKKVSVRNESMINSKTFCRTGT